MADETRVTRTSRAGRGRQPIDHDTTTGEMSDDQQRQPPEPATAEPSAPASSDVVLIHNVSADGKRIDVLRYRNERVEHGALRPVQQGQPVHGELVRLRPRPDFPLLCDVSVELAAPKAAPPTDSPSLPRKGPAQVATERYRNNWDRIWKRDLPN